MKRIALGAAVWLVACGPSAVEPDAGAMPADAFVSYDANPRRDGGARPDAAGDAGPDPFLAPVELDDDTVRAVDGDRLFAASTPCRAPMLGRVVHIADGDTITVESLDGRTEERVRLLSVNSPEVAHSAGETDECMGPEARTFTRALDGHLVWLTFDVSCIDPYGRTLAFVWVGDGEAGLWQRQLVRRGLAREFVIAPNHALEATVRADQAAAMRDGRGLWSACP